MSSDIVERRYLLVKRGLYYRPDNCGYIGIKEYAGRYLQTDARPISGVTAIHEDDAPEFSAACFDDLAREYLQKKITEAAATIEADRAEIAALTERLAQAEARTAAAVLAERERCARVAQGPYRDAPQHHPDSPFYGSDLTPDRSDFGRGKQAGRSAAAAAIRQIEEPKR